MSSPSSSADAPPLPCPLQAAGRKPVVTPWSTFWATTAFLPVWAVTILPVSISYQLGKAVFQPVLGANKEQQKQRKQRLDSGYVVDEQQIVPRAQRKYDIVVMGATGFTGKLAARYLAQTYGVGKAATVQWAIAGRSMDKLQAVKQALAKELELNEQLVMDELDTIVVDVTIPSTLPRLVEQTRVVATAAGPYSLYGSPVVEFCAKFGTHYVDITGEVSWVQAMIQQWSETARQTGAKLVPFCGHDSIPWDLCVLLLQQELQEKCADDLQTVTFWDQNRLDAPGGTYATILGMLHGQAIQAERAEFDPLLQQPDGSKSEYVVKEDLPSFIGPSQSPFVDAAPSSSPPRPWTMPFLMATVNAKVVRWSHALRSTGKNRSLVYREYLVQPDFKSAFTNYAKLIMLGSALLNPLTRPMIQRRLFQPGQGPSMDKMLHKNFLCVKGEGIGVQGHRAECIMYFNRDAGCLDTARMMVEAGLCLARQEDQLPAIRGGSSNSSGGLFSPAAALGNVLHQRLVATGTTFASRIVPPPRSKL